MFHEGENYPEISSFQSGEQAWKDFSALIAEDIQTRLASRIAERWGSERAQEKIAQILTNEQDFVVRTWDTFTELRQLSDKPLIGLFDIDETLARIIRLGEEPERSVTILRPASILLLSRIQLLPNIRLGLITSRVDLKENFSETGHLKILRPYLSPDYIYSGSDLPESSKVRLASARDQLELADQLESIIDPQIISNAAMTEDPSVFSSYEDAQKSLLVKEVLQQHPDKAFVIVDNAAYPHLFGKHNPHLRGVSLNRSGAFVL